MGFLERFKYHLVLGKLIGFVFFPSKKSNTNSFALIWITPFLIVYLCGTINGITLYPEILTQEKFIQLGDIGILLVGHFSIILRILYYFIKRKTLPELLDKIDRFDDHLKLKRVGKKEKQKLIFLLLIFVLIVVNDFVITTISKENFFLSFLFVIGICIVVLHQFFIYEILNKLLEQFQIINKQIFWCNPANKMQVISKQNNPKNFFRVSLKLRQNVFMICEEANHFFGFPILVNITFALVMAIVSVYYFKTTFSTNIYLQIPRTQIWNLATFTVTIWSIQQWILIENEVSF